MNNFEKDNLDTKEEHFCQEEQEENTKQNADNYSANSAKITKNIIFVLAFVIAVMEVAFGFLGINFDIKIVVEGLSMLLAVLLSMGFLKLKQKKTYTELKDEIENTISAKKEEISSTIEVIKESIKKKDKN